jgi:hypothetical protein
MRKRLFFPGICEHRRLLPLGMLILVLFGNVPGVFAQKRLTLDDYRRQFHQRQEQYLLELEKLAGDLQQAGRSAEAATVEQQIELLSDSDARHRPLPKTVRETIPPGATPDIIWKRKWRNLQDDHASELYSFAMEVMRRQHIGLGYRIARTVLQVNPDHAQARQMLGYVRDGIEWMTPFTLQKKKDGEIWDKRYGWIRKDDLGLRPYRNRWLPADQERNVRLSRNDLWEIRTEHWVIRTNHSLERGVEIAGKLEDYFQFFIREFPGLFNNRGQMKQLLQIGKNARARVDNSPLQVNYYATRDDYLEHLKDHGPVIAATNGIYLQSVKTSFFYARDDKPEEAESTIYHEATHQILFESRRTPREIAHSHHFWVVEGFACYMESYRNRDGEISLGDPRFIRFDNARVRLILDRFYVKLEEYTSWGQKKFQSQPKPMLGQLYSQASGLVHFFLHANDGQYRDDFVRFLAEIYASRRRDDRDVSPLDRLTGKEYSELDKEYVRYIARQAEQLALEDEEARRRQQQSSR